MCLGCYEEYGKPEIINETTVRAAQLIGGMYLYSSVGGNAHIVVDDWNLEDQHIRWCLDKAIPDNLHGADATQLAAEEYCLNFMLGLTLEERASAMAIAEGFLGPRDI